MRTLTPSSEDRREMAGRIYEAMDLRMALEDGTINTIEEARKWVEASIRNMQGLMDLPQWAMCENCYVDCKASVALASRDPFDG